VTGKTARRGRELGLDSAAFLANNDSHSYFSRLDDCLTPGPTRTNVNDLMLLLLF
jgi:hydroxypyruvate reductase